jgi:hypothetical protein
MAGEDRSLCSICFKSVNLKDCKIDEYGRPVHETCYAARVLHTLPSAGKPSGNSPPRRTRVAALMSENYEDGDRTCSEIRFAPDSPADPPSSCRSTVVEKSSIALVETGREC